MMKRTPFLSVGVFLALAALGLSALERTALPVVLDLSLATCVTALGAALFLLGGFWREIARPELKAIRLTVVSVLLLVSIRVVAVSFYERFLTYRAVEVRFANAGIDLAGTMFLPQARGPHPAVVMVHGSGPETRQEYAFFAKLCARENFVGLAYDKRGSGKSTGKLYTSDY